MNKEEFVKELEKIGIIPTNYQLEQLQKYYQLLIEWNEKINLTAITEEKQVYLKHFYDSLTLNKAIELDKFNTLCDIGTGAGFPGIVLKIFFPNLNITLVDSLQKRVIFLQEVIKELKLNNIIVLHARAEEFAKDNREKYEIVTARAVANLSTLSEYCIPLVKKDFYFVPMKADISQEIKEAENAIKKLGGKLEETYEFFLPIEESKRTILKIKKMDQTNKKYPRKYNEMKKNPLK